MRTCKYCKYWERYRNSACDRIVIDDEALMPPGDACIAIRADDDQGLDGDLITGPDFGCVLFEEKDQ